MSTSHPSPSALQVYGVLALGVMAASSSAILIRLAQHEETPSLVIAAGRMCFSTILLLPGATLRARKELLSLSRADLGLGLLMGLFLGLHMVTWITSLSLTSVASAVVLCSTTPLWTGIGAWLLHRERLSRGVQAGIALSLVGSVFIGLASGAGSSGEHSSLGDLLALVGGITGAVYLMASKELRKRYSLVTVIWLSISTAALLLLGFVGASGLSLFGWSAKSYLLILGMALVPQLLGHTSLNWSLRFLPATFVAISGLGESVGSAIWAWFLFGDRFSVPQLLGFSFILAGIAAAGIWRR